ncbi:MAG: hypothetical protein A2498_01220 [Lentisphaerae bacterium RIFOXYC12_FULL_60_16]|nr:MAG: hypothetical protein A2498_01220 [Lentisphaerae bacterium RIFOXYC12_FULL_60_16]OGV85038.1 MAG: hypothetical protein A2340_10055 [Lentisphaerae bacterium RIFOXYB12_FULL_60_10]
MMPFSLFLALKYLRPNRSFISVVTVISMLGVLLGVAILVIVLSVMTGFDAMWREKILSFKPHLTVYSNGEGIEDPDGVSERLERLPGVTGVTPSIQTRVLVRFEDRMAAPVVLGVDPERAASVSRIPENTRYGRFDLHGSQVVVGVDLAVELGLGLGSSLLVYSPLNVVRQDELYLPLELTVTGIFDMGMRDFDGGFVLTSLDVARELVGETDGARTIFVMTDDAFQFARHQETVERELGPGYSVQNWTEIDRVLFNALSHEKTMMFVLLVFITIVAIFCVTNTLIVITVQKTNEIGLLKALGFSSGKIMAAFVWHGWIQCLAGTAAGIGAGLLVLHNLRRIVGWLALLRIEVFPKAIYGLSEIPWKTSWIELTQIGVFVMVFCTLASIIPAWRAARLDPVRALRHE